MLNNLGAPGLLVILAVLTVVYFAVITPAIRRSRKNSTGVMFEISPIFWVLCSLIFGAFGLILVSFADDPQLLREVLMNGQNPRQVQSTMKSIGFSSLGVGGIFLAIGLVRGIVLGGPKR